MKSAAVCGYEESPPLLPSISHAHAAGARTFTKPSIRPRDVDVYSGEKQAIRSASVDIGFHEVLVLIGPPSCGKSTFLRCLNRVHDFIVDCRVTDAIPGDDRAIDQDRLDAFSLRAQVGRAPPKANPFPTNIFEAMAYGACACGFTTGSAE